MKKKEIRSKILGRRTSKFYGVSLNSLQQQWCANICINSDLIHLGAYDNEQEAAYAFNLAFKNFSEVRYIIKNFVHLSDKAKKTVRKRVFAILARKGYEIREQSRYLKKYEKLLSKLDREYFAQE